MTRQAAVLKVLAYLKPGWPTIQVTEPAVELFAAALVWPNSGHYIDAETIEAGGRILGATHKQAAAPKPADLVAACVEAYKRRHAQAVVVPSSEALCPRCGTTRLVDVWTAGHPIPRMYPDHTPGCPVGAS